MKTHLSPFSIYPIDTVEHSDSIVTLSKEMSIMWFTVGLGGGAGLMSLGVLSGIEPLPVLKLLSKEPLIWILLILMLSVTSLFTYKQWSYYFRKSGVGKEGIFVQTIGVVNRLEETIDAILSFWIGLLLASSASPTIWLIILCAYSFLVIVRAFITLVRSSFAAALKKKNYNCPPHYSKMHKMHNGLLAPAVLWGWIIVHSALSILAIISAIIFLKINIPVRVDILYRSIVIIILVSLMYLSSETSYRIGIMLHAVDMKYQKQSKE